MPNAKIIIFILAVGAITAFGGLILILPNFLDVIIISGIFVLIIALVRIYDIARKAPFKENSECADAVIYELAGVSIGNKTPCLYYSYIVDGREYKGCGYWRQYEDTLSVGDAIAIIYSKRNPSRSITKREFES